jgi:predicted transport protein
MENMLAGIHKAQAVWVSDLPNGSERLIQDLIAGDPSVLTLGPLVLRDKERVQRSAGRLDILLRDADGTAWYEVEVQLGKTDESHIIRTIEYWDIERRRYPDIRHTAVIVAEEITSRFFNVISLFNQSIPIIAVKLTALKLGDQYGVIFTKILDYERKGMETDEDSQTTTREDWVKWSATSTMAIADQILAVTKELDSGFEFKYTKSYITTKLEGKGRTFIYLVPQKKQLKIWVTLKSDPALDKLCQDAGIDPNFSSFYGGYQFDLRPGDVEIHRDFLKNFIGRLYKAGGD